MHPNRVIPGLFRAVAVLAAGIGVLTGCGTPANAPAGPSGSPGTRAAPAGLEISWWIVGDAPPAPGGTPLRDVLASIAARPVPVAWQALDSWRANGLRVYSAPAAELEKIRERVHLVGPLHSTWIIESPRWREIARGAELRSPQSILIEGSPAVLQDGHLRLMFRCWNAPSGIAFGDPPAGVLGVFRLECVPQHVPARRESPSFVLPGSDATNVSGPLTFASLGLEASLLGDEALLIVPESPGEPTGAGSEGLGPMPPRSVTLGEALLATERAQGVPRTRTIIVIAPTPPGEFRLLDRAR